ncbi:MAG: hypothetical protein GC190_19165 [Alphaproteobacteria bacterium]|nr:hypothetical protein [Alphaproteobacteria bacterium]
MADRAPSGRKGPSGTVPAPLADALERLRAARAANAGHATQGLPKAGKPADMETKDDAAAEVPGAWWNKGAFE